MRVYHPRFGNGTVIRDRHGVFELLVKFDSGLETWVRQSEVQSIDSEKVEKKILASQAPAFSLRTSTPALRMKCILESLRLGIVPSEGLESFTFGRAKSVRETTEWLGDDKKGALTILGDYGAGKTHFFEYMKEYCISKGYAIAYVELDPNESPLSRPKLVYNHILRALTFKNGSEFGNFRDLMRRFAGRTGNNFTHPYLDVIVDAIRNNYDDDKVWEWIEGERVSLSLKPMYDHSTAANLYCNLLSAVGAVSLELGLSGLVVMLDEAEEVENVSYTYQLLRGFNLLRGLSLLTSNNRKLLTEDLKWARESGDVREILHGKDTELVYSGLLRDTRYTAKVPCGVKVMVGFTRTSYIESWVKSISGVTIDLEPLTALEKSKILNSLYQNYRVAYPGFDCSQHIPDFASYITGKFGDNTRMMIKSFIEGLDLLRSGSIAELSELAA